MCLIVHREKPEAVIPADHWTRGTTRNPDGWGIMFADGGKIVTRKGLRARGLKKAIRAAGDRPYTVHLRLATHGKIDVDNCHPFAILGGGFAVMHNGIIRGVQPAGSDRSDTYHFAHDRLSPLLAEHPEWFDSRDFEADLAKLAVGHNKVVVMRRDGAVKVAGRALGEESDGVWYSNGGYRPNYGFGTFASAPTAVRDWLDWEDDPIERVDTFADLLLLDDATRLRLLRRYPAFANRMIQEFADEAQFPWERRGD